jgi:hypothetical protein
MINLSANALLVSRAKSVNIINVLVIARIKDIVILTCLDLAKHQIILHLSVNVLLNGQEKGARRLFICVKTFVSIVEHVSSSMEFLDVFVL